MVVPICGKDSPNALPVNEANAPAVPSTPSASLTSFKRVAYGALAASSASCSATISPPYCCNDSNPPTFPSPSSADPYPIWATSTPRLNPRVNALPPE